MLNVLIVDDSRVFRRGLDLRLRIERSINVVGTAKNGQEAVLLAEKLRPDVILMDQNMPVLNGVEATKEIKRDFPGVRIIFVTAEITARSQALKAGAEAFLLKEQDFNELMAMWREAGDVVMSPASFVLPA